MAGAARDELSAADAGRRAVEAVWRIESARIVGALARYTGDFPLAEDVASDALADVKEQLDDLAGKYTVFTAEDRNDIDENVADFAEHVAQGNDALIQQDLAVMERSADHIRDDVNEVSAAAWDGFRQGLAECTQ